MKHAKVLLLILSIALAVLVCTGSFSLAQDVACVSPLPLARTNGAAWPRGTSVTVIINPTDFPSDEQRHAIQSAFVTWQNANPNSGVTFTFTTGPQPAPGSQINTYYVRRGATTTGGDTNIGFSGSLSTTGNTTQSAVTIVDSSITRLSTITNMMVHEIGHTFGLDDCMDCEQGSSIMSTYRNDCFCVSYPCDHSAPFNGMRWGCPPLTRPRDCEVTTVALRAGYPTPTPTPIPTPTPTPQESGGLACNDWEDNDNDGLIDCEDGGCARDCIDGCNSVKRALCEIVGAPLCIFGQCYTPILIDINGDGFKLTDARHGVWFSVVNGQSIPISWTTPDSDDAWLVLDRNGNGSIDNGEEMFGNATPQPMPPPGIEKNGFLALAEYDKPASGGNADGVINASDAVFESLLLWQDTNHNGVSDVGELHTLLELGVATLELTYKESKRTDQYGNQFRYRAKVKDQYGNQIGRWAWDVLLKIR